MKYIISLLIFSFTANAAIHLAPPNFIVKDNPAVWVDFKLAEYQITYDTINATANVVTTITFEQKRDGHPLFDLKNKPKSISVDGVQTTQKLVSTPGKATVVRMIQKSLKAGTHTLRIHSTITSGTRFNDKRENWGTVSSAFFIRDLKDRMFLEKYLPTNFEYDNYKMIMDVEVTGTKRFHSLFANGEITKLSNFHYRVEFPEYYAASSVFFHFVPINKYVRWRLNYPSIDGRQIPVTIYSSYRFYNNMLKKKAWNVLKELEKDYGPWPHDKVTIYGTGIKGGMEYAGATETSIVSLGHELQHSYYAKGITPANGNSGWLDEAIASWRDKGHQSIEKPFFESSNIGGHNPYTRKTDKRSYEYGRSFMAYLDFKLKAAGDKGLKSFLRSYISKRMHSSINTEIFRMDLEEYSGLDFSQDFKKYIYGEKEKMSGMKRYQSIENPHHPEISQETLDSII